MKVDDRESTEMLNELLECRLSQEGRLVVYTSPHFNEGEAVSAALHEAGSVVDASVGGMSEVESSGSGAECSHGESA